MFTDKQRATKQRNQFRKMKGIQIRLWLWYILQKNRNRYLYENIFVRNLIADANLKSTNFNLLSFSKLIERP